MADDTAQPGPGAHLDLNRKNAANAATLDRPPAQAPAANRNRPQQAPPQPLQQPPAQQPPQQPPAQVPAGPRVDQQPAAPVGMENAEANPLLQALWRNQGAEDTQARAAPHATVTATVSKHRELGPLVEGFKADRHHVVSTSLFSGCSKYWVTATVSTAPIHRPPHTPLIHSSTITYPSRRAMPSWWYCHRCYASYLPPRRLMIIRHAGICIVSNCIYVEYTPS